MRISRSDSYLYNFIRSSCRRVRHDSLVLAVLVVAISLDVVNCSRVRDEAITQDELVRRTQEIMDAVAPGDRQPFEKYFAPDSMIFDEKGRSMDKKAFVARRHL